MQDAPAPVAMLEMVAEFLREIVLLELDGAVAYQTRICAKVIDIIIREWQQRPAADAAELAKLQALLGSTSDDLIDLNWKLVEHIRSGKVTLSDRALEDHLWRTTLAKLAVDQPKYPQYCHVIETSN